MVCDDSSKLVVECWVVSRVGPGAKVGGSHGGIGHAPGVPRRGWGKKASRAGVFDWRRGCAKDMLLAWWGVHIQHASYWRGRRGVDIEHASNRRYMRGGLSIITRRGAGRGRGRRIEEARRRRVVTNV